MSNEKLNICLLCRPYLKNKKGAEFSYSRMAKALTDKGHTVHIVTRKGEEVSYYNDPNQLVFVHAINLKGNPSLYTHIRYSIAAAKKIKEIQKSHPIDIIQAPDWILEKFWSVFYKKPSKILSHFDRFLKESSSHSSPIKTSDKGIDQNVYKPGNLQREQSILFVGNLEQEKGIKIVAEAIPQVLKDFPDIKFVFAGQAMGYQNTQKTWKDYLSETLPKENLVFYGQISTEEIVSCYQKSLISIFPSFIEPAGTSVLESMACGCATIATRVGGFLKNIEDGKDGLLIPQNNPEALAVAIKELLKDDSLRKKISLNAVERITSEFSLNSPIVETFDDTVSSNIVKKVKPGIPKIDNSMVDNFIFLLKCFVFPWKKKGYYIGWLGYGNLGDEALKMAIYRIFEEKFILLGYREGLIVRFLKRIGFLKFDFLVLGGGTLINDSQHWVSEILSRSVTKRFVFGTGVSNPIFWKNIEDYKDLRSHWIEVLNTFDFTGVRGPMSIDLLRNWGLKREVQLIGDPALYFTRPLRGPKKVSKRLGLNFAIPKKNLFWGRDAKQWFNEFSHFVELMLADGWDIEFLPVYKEDLEGILLLQRKFGVERIKVFKNYLSLEKTLDMLDRLDVFVGVKLHSVVLANCANTPAVMIEYRPKCRDFMASIDMERYNIRIDEFNAGMCKKLVEELYRDLEVIRVKTNKACLNYKTKLIDAALSVDKIINK